MIARVARQLCLTLPTLLASHAFGFEIKPVAPFLGAISPVVNAQSLRWREPRGELDLCHWKRSYVLGDEHQPVHEVITREAYDRAKRAMAQRKNLPIPPRNNQQTWEKPLFSGVLWNDDPEWRSRKLGNLLYIVDLLDWTETLTRGEEQPDAPELTIRSHYGDLQFLHAMRGRGEDDTQTFEKVRLWMHAALEVWIAEVGAGTPLCNTAFAHSAFDLLKLPWASTVETLFDRYKRMRVAGVTGPSEENVRELVAGSMLHILQDSYSEAHTVRDPVASLPRKAWPIKALKRYDDANRKDHCERDAAVESNREAIDAAIEASDDLLQFLWDKPTHDGLDKLLDALGFPQSRTTTDRVGTLAAPLCAARSTTDGCADVCAKTQR